MSPGLILIALLLATGFGLWALMAWIDHDDDEGDDA